MQPVASNLKVGEIVSVHMPAHRWLLLLGHLDALTGTETASYMADFLDEILSAIAEADKIQHEKANVGNGASSDAPDISSPAAR